MGIATAASHELEEHIGEIALAVRADTLSELFAEAGRALAELMTEEPSRSPASAERAEHVEVRSPDRTALLVDWLNELIFLSDAKHTVLTELTIQRISEREIVAEARGIAEPPVKTAIKAATLHEASVAVDDLGCRAHVVLDV